MGVLQDLILIQIIIVNLVDISGGMDSLKRYIARMLGVKQVSLMPFECSYCLTWWIGLIYLFCNGITLEYVAALLLICYLTSITMQIEVLIKDMLTTFINWIDTKIN